jgi:large subunit ribosomal protein L4e
MELKILNTENKETGKQKLPIQFEEEIRPDLIKRAVEAIQSHQKQAYGSDPRAGKKQAAKLSRRRRDYKGAYGKGLGRMPRKTLTRRGEQMIWVGAFAPGTVKGRRAFPPTSEHIIAQKINHKERKKATRSAMAATMDKEIVALRGHKTPANYPFIISTDIEKVTKTSELAQILETLGLKEELERAEEKKVRSGVGKLRGRRYRKTKGPLLVVSGKCNALNAAKNIPGVDVIEVASMNAELLAPGTHPGRLTIFTQAAIQKLDKEKLFI